MTHAARWTRRLLALLFLAGCAGSPVPPTDRASLYGAGLFSTGQWDFFLALTPDERTALFCRADSTFSTYQILESRRDAGGHWSAPVVPSFAGTGSNADPHFTVDGRTLYFISNRASDSASAPSATYDIWRVRRSPDGTWSTPERVAPPVSMAGVDEWSPSISRNGTLYFGSDRPGGRGGLDLYAAKDLDTGFAAPENLGDSINTIGHDVEPWIAPDESYLVFSARDRPDSLGKYDLYLSRQLHGVWQRARRLGPEVNTPANEFNQSVSPDGAWLYFSSSRPLTGALGERFDVPRDPAAVAGIGNGTGDIYRIPTRILLADTAAEAGPR